MKLQYFGDSQDSFKWDYHSYLVDALGYDELKIVWMMTPDDGSGHGKSSPEQFPARREIIDFCHALKASRNPNDLLRLPEISGGRFRVKLHDANPRDRGRSFSSRADVSKNQVLFLDPDIGFEPEKSSTDAHIRYPDVELLLKKADPSTVITVFQHHRRKKFPDDFAEIREKLHSGYSTAIYWQLLMFVCLSTSEETIDRVREINQRYAELRPVSVIP